MKRVLSFVLILLFAFSLSACGENKPAVQDPTQAPAQPTAVPTEKPAPDPTADPTEEPFVPSGYNAHDYLALAAFFGTVVGDNGETVGDVCYYDSSFKVSDPETWRTGSFGVKWDSEGYVTEISFYPMLGSDRFPAALELVGFERLEEVRLGSGVFDSVTVKDCPKLGTVYTARAVGEVDITAGFVGALSAASDKRVRCDLTGSDGEPFTLDLYSEGPGYIRASAAILEDGYHVTATAVADDYAELLGWYDENGELVSTEKHFALSGGELGKITGEHRYTAKFAMPSAPDPLSEGDFFCELKPFAPASIDIDGDGREDTVLLSCEEYSYGEDTITVTVTLSSRPDAPFVLDAEHGYNIFAAAVDTNTEDGRIEIIVSFEQDSNDPVTYVFRLKDDGSGFDAFAMPIELGNGSWQYRGLPEDYVYRASEGLPFMIRTEILGTTYVMNHFTVTKDGIKFLSDEFTYDHVYPLTLTKELTVTLENGKKLTLPVGAAIAAYSTDRKSWVKVKLEDGRIGKIKVGFGEDGYFPVYLNGVIQDEYADIPYAD
ncbi:MAG: PT domain-containing protein [Clostridiales bacterium]|nr:PT domain-containing protein [Clostridiales bacterium]